METAKNTEKLQILADKNTILKLSNIFYSVENGVSLGDSSVRLLNDCMSALKESFDGRNLAVAVQLYEISNSLLLFSSGDIAYLRSYIFEPVTAALNIENKISAQRKDAVLSFLNSLLGESADISLENAPVYKKKARACLAFVFKSLDKKSSSAFSDFDRSFIAILDDIIDEISQGYEISKTDADIAAQLMEALSVDSKNAQSNLGTVDVDDEDSGPFRALVPADLSSYLEEQDEDLLKYREFLSNLDNGVLPDAITHEESLDYLNAVMRELEHTEIIDLNRAGNSSAPFLSRKSISEKYERKHDQYLKIIATIFSNITVNNEIPACLDEGWTLDSVEEPLAGSTHFTVENGHAPLEDAEFLVSGEFDLGDESSEPLNLGEYVEFMNAIYEDRLYFGDSYGDSDYFSYLAICLDKSLKDSIAFNAKQGFPETEEQVRADFMSGPKIFLTIKLGELLAKRADHAIAERFSNVLNSDSFLDE